MDSKLLREIVKYNKKTGEMIWKMRGYHLFEKSWVCDSWNTRYSDKKIRTIDGKGYLVMTAFGKRYTLHRLAWLYVKGYWPLIIDHINGDKLDNRFCNLREVTNQENHMNNRRASNNTSGVTGVYYNKKRNLWCAQMKFNGKTYHLGSSKDFNDVVMLRKKEEKLLGFSKRHGS